MAKLARRADFANLVRLAERAMELARQPIGSDCAVTGTQPASERPAAPWSTG